MIYKNKLSTVEALQFIDNAERLNELSDFMGEGMSVDYADKDHPILKYNNPTEGGVGYIGVEANQFDYIVKIEEGNFVACPSLMFETLYVENGNGNENEKA